MQTLLNKNDVEFFDHYRASLQPEKVLNRIADLAYCVTDEKGCYVEVNDFYTELYGYSQEELIGKHFTMVVPEGYKEFARNVHDDFISGEVEMPAEWNVIDREGKSIRIYVEAVRVETPNGPSKLTIIERLG